MLRKQVLQTMNQYGSPCLKLSGKDWLQLLVSRLVMVCTTDSAHKQFLLYVAVFRTA